MLLNAPKDPDPGGLAFPSYVYTQSPSAGAQPSETGAPSPSRVAMPVPEGFARVAGPGGIVTTIPVGWLVTRSSGPGAMQATDPADPNRYVRYGGAPVPSTDLVESHVDYERTYSATRKNFLRYSLGTTTYHGVQALDWDFEHDVPDGKRRAHSMYWRVNGIEYFLYASSTTPRWPETLPIFHTMIDNTTP
ncbi:hypothetical protein Acsp05_27370 [Actinokineospora sp. NBRC 105648]|nr:hypothetical protein Acsp05_27370 [Actinokineospora sp. NBRC 105648]